LAFREYYNKTLEKQASYNLNIIRKLALSLSVLKLFNIFKHKVSLKSKRFAVSLNPLKLIEQILEI